MHYYQFNIGNYRRDTIYLSLLEHAVYRQLIDTYYLEEQPLCDDHARLMRTHCIRTKEEQLAMQNILADFFIHDKDAGLYRHPDIDQHLEKYQEKSEKARKSANSRWKKSECNAKSIRTHSEGNANHKPLTINKEPITSIKESKEKAKRFVPPQLQNVIDYCNERVNNVDANKFIDHYTSNGWLVGKNKMKDWKAAVRTWEKTSFKQSGNTSHDDWKQDLLNSDYSHILGD